MNESCAPEQCSLLLLLSRGSGVVGGGVGSGLSGCGGDTEGGVGGGARGDTATVVGLRAGLLYSQASRLVFLSPSGCVKKSACCFPFMMLSRKMKRASLMEATEWLVPLALMAPIAVLTKMV